MKDYLKSKIEYIKSSDLFMFISLAFFVLVTRLPFINSDYALDPDAFQVVRAAKHISKTGEYIYSRPPGNPVYEYIISIIANSSPWVTNLLSAIASSVVVIFLALILRHLKIKNYYILPIFFSLVPIIYINSISTMDYMIALSFALGSTYFILIRQPILAGIFIGLAIGCRLTYVAMGLPLVLWVLYDKNNVDTIRHALYFVFTSILVSILVYLPVFLSYGFGFFTFADNIEYPSLLTLIEKGIINVWGVLYLAAFIILLSLMLWKKEHLKIHSKKAFLFSIGVIFIYIVIFLRLPHESAYMIPVVPFVIISLALIVPSHYIRFFSLSVIALVFIQLLNGTASVQKYNDSRSKNYSQTKSVIDSVSKLKGKVVVIAGWKIAKILLFETSKASDRVKYVYLVQSKENYNNYIISGYSVYYLKGMYEFNNKVYNINLKELGAKELKIPLKKEIGK